jgi:hypothetical protein
MIKYFRDVKIQKLVQDICDEHHQISKVEDNNMGYLWYMYAHGTKKGDFKPFMFLAEINLLKATSYITDVEKENLISMMTSKDEDNIYITALSLLTLRTQRITDLGLWAPENEKYKDINYTRDVVNPELFMKKVTPYTL